MGYNSVDSVGYNFMNDPYALYALNSYNPNFMGYGAVSAPSATTAATAAADTTAVTPAVDPTFKGSDIGSAKDSGIGAGTIATVAGLGVSAAASIMAFRKGKASGYEGLKAVGQGFKEMLGFGAKKAAAGTSESVAEKIANLIKEKGLQECQVKNGTDLIKIKNGAVSEITARTEQKLKNIAGVSVPAGINPKSKDVTLSSIERTITHKGKNYKVVLDKEGNVVEAFLGKKKIDAAEVEGLVDKAQTYTHEFAGRKVHLKDRSGNYREYTRNVELSVKNGEVVGARYKDGANWVDIADDVTLSKLKSNFETDIAKFGQPKGGYGLTPQECIYEYTGSNRRYLFNGNRKVTEAYDIKSTPLKTPKQVSDYLEKHGIQDIAKTGKLPDGATIANATYKSETGNIYTIKDGKIESIKIKDACTIKSKKGTTYNYRAGEVITKDRLNTWQQGLAVNNNDYDAVLALIK